ncbi:MAG: peptide deformylase [Hyphomicrobiales bacterium]
MAIREIITLPDPLLRKPSDPVERVDGELLKLADDMLETMYDAPGLGLAAVQVAVPRRLIVMDTSWREPEEEGGEPAAKSPIVMINPEILEFSEELRPHEEGCLSIPDYYAEIERPRKIRVRYLDREGKPREITAEDVLATVIQHEVDHLDGKLFIDYLSRLRRDRVIKKFVKAARGEVIA